jgi:hypothetical protein
VIAVYERPADLLQALPDVVVSLEAAAGEGRLL